jgi:hypothetical protein
MNDKEELKRKLRAKINQKASVRKGGVTRKESHNLSDKIQKLVELLQEENITVNTQLTEELIEKVTGILSINEIKKVLSQIESNPEISDNFKTFMQNVSNFKPP